MADARISTALPAHPKTKKLIRKLGASGAWYLVRLFLWAAENRSTGDLSGLSNDDIELAVDFDGAEGEFLGALVSVGFVDGEEGSYSIHDWEEHNPWAAGSEARSVKAKWNAMKRHHGAQAADAAHPEYAAIRSQVLNSQHASSKQVAMHNPDSSNAPSPSPSPLPSPSPSPSPLPSPLPTDKESADRSASSRMKVLRTYINECKEIGVKPIPDDHYIRTYAEDSGITAEMLGLCWHRFIEEHTTGARKLKKYKDWTQTFANCVKDNWFKFWYVKDGEVVKTSQCELFKAAFDAKRAKGE